MALSKITNASVADTAVHGRRNLIINGAMQVSQRGDQSVSSGNSYSLDRWEVATTGGSAAYDLSQSTDAPSGQGFGYSWKLDVTTADSSLAAGDGYIFRQAFEGQNLQSVKKGTSNAEKLTLQFWIKSSKTGTYVVEMYDTDNTRQVSASYTVNTADTWEKKVITFPADTSTGDPWDNDNARSAIVQFWLMAGSNYTSGTLNTAWADATTANRVVGQVNALDNASNNIYFTGLQLEIGDTATPFEHRSFGEELALCQRYFCKSYAMDKYAGATDDNDNQCTLARINSTVSNRTVENAKFPVRMRVKPTVTIYSLNGTSGSISDTGTNAGTHTRDEIVGINKYGETGIAWFSSVNSFTAGDGAGFHFTADAEL